MKSALLLLSVALLPPTSSPHSQSIPTGCEDLGSITFGPPSACVEATFLVLPPIPGKGVPDWAFTPPHNLNPDDLDPGLLDPNHCVIDILYTYALEPCSPVALIETSPSIAKGVIAQPGVQTFGTREAGFRVPPGFEGNGFFALELADGTPVLRWDYESK